MASHVAFFVSGEDWAGIESGRDLMDGYALGSVIDPGPEVRVSASVPGKEADVDVDDSVGELGDQLLGEDVAVSERDDPFGGVIA